MQKFSVLTVDILVLDSCIPVDLLASWVSTQVQALKNTEYISTFTIKVLQIFVVLSL